MSDATNVHEDLTDATSDRFEAACRPLLALKDEALGNLIRECLCGTTDTNFEGYTEVQRDGIIQFLEDIGIAHRSLSQED